MTIVFVAGALVFALTVFLVLSLLLSFAMGLVHAMRDPETGKIMILVLCIVFLIACYAVGSEFVEMWAILKQEWDRQ